MAELTAIGLMSGTSMDGIDAAVLTTDGQAHIAFGPTAFFPYPVEFRRRIELGLEAAKAITLRGERPGDLASLERDMTLRHAQAVLALTAKLPRDMASPEIIGFHGQTVLHRPQLGLTVQLGDGAQLA